MAVGTAYRTDSALMSAAMLGATYKAGRGDTLDCIMPFARVAIGKTANPGEEVKAEEIADYLNIQFGFATMPISVASTLLKRLSPRTLEKKNGRYYLKASLAGEVEEFEKRHMIYKAHCESVGKALSEWIADKVGGPELSVDGALDLLFSYFSLHGLAIHSEPYALNAVAYNKKNHREYQVGKFILAVHDEDSVLLGYLMEMLQGFFLTLAVSLDGKSEGRAKFSETICYLDTRLILFLLGYVTDEDKKATRQVLGMLHEQGAKVCVFSHTLDEVRGILMAYRASLINPRSRYGNHTLEHFDRFGYGPRDIELVITQYRTDLRILGVTEVAAPVADPRWIDSDALKAHLDESVYYTNEHALEHDVESVRSIATLRAGARPDAIEKCGHLFVTTNTDLARGADSLPTQSGGPGSSAPYVISEPRLTALLWLKCYSTHKDYPKARLVQDALASTAASADVLEAFFQQVQLLKACGGVSEEQALAMRSGIFDKRVLMTMVGGDPSKVDEGTVRDVEEKLHEKYAADFNAAIAAKDDELRAIKAENEAKKNRALQRIHDTEATVEKRWEKMLTCVAGALFAIALLGGIVLTCIDTFGGGLSAGSIVLAVFGGLGIWDTLSERSHAVRQLITHFAVRVAARVANKEREIYEALYESPDGHESPPRH